MAQYFTVEEANAIIQQIRPLVKEMLEIRQALVNRQPDVWPVIQKALGNGGSRAASHAAAEMARLETLLREIQASGAEVKDINTGLLDFRSRRSEREVYLCWRYDEERIQYWHDLDAGFAGRQPL